MKKYLPLLLIIVLASVLRLYAISDFPNGLNADEAALGYNAYSLLETGKDEHNNAWPLAFRSFDDYKPPLYVYLVLPFIKILGLTVFAVRLPSALLGIGTVILIFFLTNFLFPKFDLKTKYLYLTPGDLSGFLLAISPWHLHFSRGAWEVNIATFFLLLGLYSFLKALKNPYWYFVTGLALVASLYAYHSMRIVAPLIGLTALYLYFPEFKKSLSSSLKPLLAALTLTFLLSLPLAYQTFAGGTTSRFSGVGLFADQGPLWQALEHRNQHPSGSLVARVLHNRYLSYSLRFTQNYLSHYSPRFLFINGDEIARSKVPGLGQSYLFLFPFVIIGLFYLFKNWSRGEKLILAWLLLAPLPAALTFQSPHALRAQNMVIPLSIIISLGIFAVLRYLKKYLLITLTVFLLVSSYNLVSYLHQYYDHYPKELPFAWQYGFKDLTTYLEPKIDQYDKIIISDRYDQPYILIAFFLQYPPEKLQQELVFSDRDNFGFSTGRSFGNFEFHHITEDDFQKSNTLVVTADESAPANTRLIHSINYPNEKPAFQIYEVR